MKSRFLLFSFVLIAGHCVRAQEVTPEKVVEVYFSKVASGGLSNAVDQMHPDELKKFRAAVEPTIERAIQRGQTKALGELGKGDLKSMSDVKFTVAYFRLSELAQPEIKTALKGAKISVLGHVQEGELSHVLVRVKTPEADKLTIVTVKPYNGKPMLALSSDMQGIADRAKGNGR